MALGRLMTSTSGRRRGWDSSSSPGRRSQNHLGVGGGGGGSAQRGRIICFFYIAKSVVFRARVLAIFSTKISVQLTCARRLWVVLYLGPTLRFRGMLCHWSRRLPNQFSGRTGLERDRWQRSPSTISLSLSPMSCTNQPTSSVRLEAESVMWWELTFVIAKFHTSQTQRTSMLWFFLKRYRSVKLNKSCVC